MVSPARWLWWRCVSYSFSLFLAIEHILAPIPGRVNLQTCNTKIEGSRRRRKEQGREKNIGRYVHIKKKPSTCTNRHAITRAVTFGSGSESSPLAVPRFPPPPPFSSLGAHSSTAMNTTARYYHHWHQHQHQRHLDLTLAATFVYHCYSALPSFPAQSSPIQSVFLVDAETD